MARSGVDRVFAPQYRGGGRLHRRNFWSVCRRQRHSRFRASRVKQCVGALYLKQKNMLNSLLIKMPFYISLQKYKMAFSLTMKKRPLKMSMEWLRWFHVGNGWFNSSNIAAGAVWEHIFYSICWLICKTYIKRMLHRTWKDGGKWWICKCRVVDMA